MSLTLLAKNYHSHSFGTLMGLIRQRCGLSARAVSLECGLSPSYVSKMERDEYLPTLDRFSKIVETIGATDEEILFLVSMLSQK